MNRMTMKAISSALLLSAMAGAASAQCDTRWVKALDGDTSDSFGNSVALSPLWLAVGAPADDSDKGVNAGSAYIYARVGDAYIQIYHAEPTTSGTVTGAGHSIDLTDKHMILGHHDSSGLQGGATIFKQVSGSWFQQATLTPAGLGASDRFGEAVAVDNVTALVGAPGDDDTGADSGAVYFFTEQGGVWTDSGKMTLFSNVGSRIGEALAIDGGTAVVGAPGRDSGGVFDSGAVFVVRQGLGWNLSQTLVDPEVLMSNEGFGEAVDVEGDLIVVGAPRASTATQTQVGTVYIFERTSTTYEYIQRIPCPDFDYTNDFGTSVAISGDVIAIGATGSNGPKTYYMRRQSDGTFRMEGVYARTFGYATDVDVLDNTIVSGDTVKSLPNYPGNTGAVESIVVNPDTGSNSWSYARPIAVPSTHTGCTSGATNDGNASCGSSDITPDVWYSFVAPSTGKISVDTIGSGYDTVVSIHAAGTPNTSLACNDDIVVGNHDSRVAMNVSAGTTYLVRVSGYDGNVGEYAFHIRMQCPADITTGAVQGQPGYGIPNGTLNNDDFFYYLSQFSAGNAAIADMTTSAVPGSPGYGQPNGQINNDDFFYYLATFASGC